MPRGLIDVSRTVRLCHVRLTVCHRDPLRQLLRPQQQLCYCGALRCSALAAGCYCGALCTSSRLPLTVLLHNRTRNQLRRTPGASSHHMPADAHPHVSARIDARTHRHSHTTHLHAARACPHTALIHRPHASTFARISPLHRFFGFEAFPCVDTGTMTRTSTLKKEEKLKLRALQLRPGPSKRAQWLLLVLGLDPSRSIWGLKPYDLKWPGRDSEAWFQQV